MTAVGAGDRVKAAAQAVQARIPSPPDVAVILGTGLGGLADAITVASSVPYEEIPGFPLSTVESHAGRLLFGTLGGRTVAAMQGRFHRYEGYDLGAVAFPVRVLRALGAGTLIVSNACAVVCPKFNTRRDFVSDRLVDSRSSLATIDALKPHCAAINFSNSDVTRNSLLLRTC